MGKGAKSRTDMFPFWMDPIVVNTAATSKRTISVMEVRQMTKVDSDVPKNAK